MKDTVVNLSVSTSDVLLRELVDINSFASSTAISEKQNVTARYLPNFLIKPSITYLRNV